MRCIVTATPPPHTHPPPLRMPPKVCKFMGPVVSRTITVDPRTREDVIRTTTTPTFESPLVGTEVKFQSLVDGMRAFLKEHHTERRNRTGKGGFERSILENRIAQVQTTGDACLERMKRMFRFLDNSPDVFRSKQQQQFHDALTEAAGRIIYRSDYENDTEAIMRRNRWGDTRQELFICTPRRFGKTWAMAMFAAILALACPNAIVSVYSTGQTAAGALLKLAKKFFRLLSPWSDKMSMVSENMTTLEFCPTGNRNDRRRISSYTSNPKISPPPTHPFPHSICFCIRFYFSGGGGCAVSPSRRHRGCGDPWRGECCRHGDPGVPCESPHADWDGFDETTNDGEPADRIHEDDKRDGGGTDCEHDESHDGLIFDGARRGADSHIHSQARFDDGGNEYIHHDHDAKHESRPHDTHVDQMVEW